MQHKHVVLFQVSQRSPLVCFGFIFVQMRRQNRLCDKFTLTRHSRVLLNTLIPNYMFSRQTTLASLSQTNFSNQTFNFRQYQTYFLLSANARLRHKARTMIGAGRHNRRRASLAITPSPASLFSTMDTLRETDENAPRKPVIRRRAVDTADYKTCAILQTRLKNVKQYPE